MRRAHLWAWGGVVCLFCVAGLGAPQDQPAGDGSSANSSAVAAVPRLIKFSGMLRDLTGQPLTGPVDANFAIYKEQADLVPLWHETQTLQLDEQGRYTVLLGAMQAEGLPMALFTSGEARWLEVAVAGAEPQPRTLLVSVPYALKAGDAETLGGKPASAFMPVSAESGVGQSVTTAVIADTGSRASALERTTGGAPTLQPLSVTPGRITKFSNSKTVEDSVMYEDAGTGSIGLGTTTPAARLHVFNGTSPGVNVPSSFAFLTSGTGTVANRSGWADGNKVTYLGTTGTLNYGEFSTYDYGSSQGFNLVLNASGGNVGIGTTTPGEKLSVVGKIESTSGGFKFPDGTTQATAATSGGGGTATDLNCTAGGCVSESELSFDPATQNELNTEAATRATADTNEANQRAAADTTLQAGVEARVLKSGDTMSGTLNLPANGLVAGTNQLVLSGGKVGIGTTTAALKFDVLDPTGLNKVAMLRRGTQGSDSSMVTSYGTPYLVIGGQEFKLNSIQSMGFGWSNGGVTKQPAEIGFQTTSTAGYTQGDLVLATRNSTTNVAPTEAMRVTSSGNVGIGTTTPGEKLSVVGKIESTSGGFKFPDGTTQATAATGGGGGTATDLNCTGCVGIPELGFDPATQDELNAEAATRVTADANEAAFRATAVTDEANQRAAGDATLQADINNRVLKSGDTMTGPLTLPADGLAVGANQLVVSGGGNVRASGLLRVGSETGTAEPPYAPSYAGLVIRRINDTSYHIVGRRVASTDVLALERDGTNGGWQIHSLVGSMPSVVACMGITNTGAAANYYRYWATTQDEVFNIYDNAANVCFLHCYLGAPFIPWHTTEVTLGRAYGDYYWDGSLISTVNQ